jgi:hypothetical protein
MGTRLGVFALLISLTVQSILTIGCGTEDLRLAAGDDVQFVAAQLPDSVSLEKYCSSCGGLRTATGCCAHGVLLTSDIVRLQPTSLPSGISSLDALPSAQRNPSSLFRPPISA